MGLKSRYPELPSRLRSQVARIEPSFDGDLAYHPVAVRLVDGREFDRIYLCEETSWFEYWGVWPEHDDGKASLAVQDIAEVRESPSRLPAEFANQLYRAGESGMGYARFCVGFQDGSMVAVLTGNAVDFIPYPPDKGPQDVARVVPHDGKHATSGPDYLWCLYSESHRQSGHKAD